MSELARYAGNRFSQFGEDGMIRHLLDIFGDGARVCVEFGANDGLSCSNTAALSEDGWHAILLEADPALAAVAAANRPTADVRQVAVQPCGPDSIDEQLALLGPSAVDVMSIDVDGDDLLIFEAMQTRPRIVVIEFNPSVPHWMNVRPLDPGSRFGASAAALIAVAHARGYQVVGATHCNLIFLRFDLARELGHAFLDVVIDPMSLFAGREYAVIASDYDGRPVLLDDRALCWGFTGFADGCTARLVMHP